MRQKKMDFLPLKDAITKYKVSDKTLRTAIANLPPEQRQVHVQTKGNKLLVSSDFLSRYSRRQQQPKIKRATAEPTAEPTDTPGPKPNTTTGEPFIWFVVGLIFGLVAIGLVVFCSGF